MASIPPQRRGARYVIDIDELDRIPASEREALRRVASRHAFRATEYYLDLIDWNDPDDPIRRIIIPRPDELSDWGRMDASNEAAVTVLPGVQHKYPHTALLLCNRVCGGHCRYCFRKRIFIQDADEIAFDVTEGINYIASHPEITNVLLTGGDPLMLPTARLVDIWERLSRIPHVGIIRVGTRMPVFQPWRILDDDELLAAISRISTPQRRLFFITHFDHPRELTGPATAAVDALLRAGAVCANQNPLVRGVNDDPVVLAELFRRLSFAGCAPYYVFQMRPTTGNKPYAVPIVRAFHIFEAAKRHVSGLAKRARFTMSHATGKVEVLIVDRDFIYLRYHRARDPLLDGRVLLFHRDDSAFWLDDLTPVAGRGYPAIPAEQPDLLEAGPE